MVLSSYLTSDPKMLVCAAWPHARTIERVVGIGFQPGLDPAKRDAPLIARSSAKQFIKVFSLEGSQLCTIRFNPTSMARKIGPVSHLTFHPYQVLLAAGAADALVSIYGFISEAAAKCPLTYIEISPKSLHFGSPGASRSAAPIPLHTQMFLEMLSVHAVLKLYAIYSLASIG
ncbi:regulatory-associated protein of TOR 1-like isoform X2 [Vitis riparia]|uniref:regulatory-associated protein of TOR 1-like isoform X2 n=1 Tax=Vitis riparia TaxID=96939 RepID=UPI00155B1DC9|nr:regulatory-associated protein of TOR 1-like isoform X2 [Vitis riparia]XP_034692785.1 regulatory-associated protein of TOR 1-like isoform X2 [Vitis riparia]XP_034692786.1 regulatory-associated protein of TOR 1-like isoform X2 [Vitis riparia]